MKKKWLSLVLALAMCLALLPAAASAAETNLPDWYFLFAIFKNVDADGKDKDGKAVHVKYTMSQDEIDVARNHAREFEIYMNQVGAICAHVDVVEINTTVTELYNEYSGGSVLDVKQAAPLLEGKADLDRYDHVTSIISLDNLKTSYLGLTGSAFENGTGHSCLNFVNREQCLKTRTPETNSWILGNPVHEFLHFASSMNKKWGYVYNLHDLRANHYYSSDNDSRNCYTDIIRNQAKGNDGTGVAPITWQYPPHVLRTTTELTVPSGVTDIGSWAFAREKTLNRVSIPSGVTSIGGAAFQACTNLTSLSLPASLTSVEQYAFANCPKLTDVYYSGSEAQWKAINISSTGNAALTKANIHYNHLLADVKTTDWFAGPVAWALEKGVTAGTGGGRFSPDDTCTQGQILTFLWRANGSPAPTGKVSGTQYYAAAVQWAKEQGVTSGTLSPNAPCTRADAVTYLWRLAGSPNAKAASFTDVPDSANYAKAVSWAVEQGVTSGVSADQFAPSAACTRAQIAAFLYRALAQ